VIASRASNTTVPFTLRTYVPADFEKLYEIDQACYEPEIAYSRRELRNYLRFPGAECVVAEENDRNEGRGVSAPSRNEGRGISAPSRNEGRGISAPKITTIGGFCMSARRRGWGYIITIDVLSEYRRQGLASLLLNEVERRLRAKKVREVALETAVDNHAAIAFWKKHGYAVQGVRPDYYPGGRDAYSMAKLFPSE
jgi:ribosomal protein S18 acetylase RimI-like enzyme